MRDRRTELLKATTKASHVLKKFPVGTRSSFDIVSAVLALDIPLMFRPLKSLWGATITVDNDLRGVLVTTILDLPVQRFTLAHELGHVLLGHNISLDESIGFMGRFGSRIRPVEELAADTFASELLAPKGLMLAAAKRHKWTREALASPANVYQLALRLGISFQATCWALHGHDVITGLLAHKLQTQTVKSLKLAVIPEKHLTNPWANAWSLTGADTDSILEAGPDDVFSIGLTDSGSSGYLWELVDAGAATILGERADIGKVYGGESSRSLLMRFQTAGRHRLTFEHRRPWNNQRLAHIDIQIENYGKEQGGRARIAREHALAAMGA